MGTRSGAVGEELQTHPRSGQPASSRRFLMPVHSPKVPIQTPNVILGPCPFLTNPGHPAPEAADWYPVLGTTIMLPS